MDTQQPTLDEWRELFAAADEFRRLAPWQWMYDSDVFGVENPETGEVGYCSVMGFRGEHFALGVYQGTEGLASHITLTEAAVERMEEGTLDPFAPDVRELFHRQHGLMASFEDRELLRPEDRAVIKKLGLKYRGRNAWPLFQRLRAYRLPWFITSADARFLAVALRQAAEVGMRCLDSPGYIEKDGEPVYLVRARKETESGPLWVNTWRPAPERVPPPPVDPYVPNDLEAARLERLPRRPELRVEVTFALVPAAINDEAGPYFPFILLPVESQSGYVLGAQVADPWDYRDKFGPALVKALEELGARPGELRVRRRELRELFSNIAERFGMDLRLSDDMPMLDETVEAFLQHIEG